MSTNNRLCTWYAKQKPTARSAEDAQQSCRLIIAEPPTRATKTLPPPPPISPKAGIAVRPKELFFRWERGQGARRLRLSDVSSWKHSV
eukprot:scaffold8123_cov95-Isochrysis_galbana.AAC.2